MDAVISLRLAVLTCLHVSSAQGLHSCWKLLVVAISLYLSSDGYY